MNNTQNLKFDIGSVYSVGNSVATILGLEKAMSGELVFFPKTGVKGLILNLTHNNVSVALLSNYRFVIQNDIVEKCNSIIGKPFFSLMVIFKKKIQWIF